MARAPDKSSAGQFSTASYTASWAANNPYYAGHVNWAFNTFDTTRGSLGGESQAALKSGVVHQASYSNIKPQDSGYDQKNQSNWASPINSSDVPYDQYGQVKKQVGDMQLGLVMMGGYQFPGNAFGYKKTLQGFVPDELSLWMMNQGTGGARTTGLRYRRYSEKWREKGWQTQLSQSLYSNKGPGGISQSSEDSTIERYSTQETRRGTRSAFTDETLNEETGKFGRSWAGFQPLSTHSKEAHFDFRLGQMFKSENPNTGAARRTPRSGL